jgi:L-threonylcarbamoyladenylate synthase
VSPVQPSDEALTAAIAALRAGEVLGLPTDTVYGLGAVAANALACRRIFQLKDRPDKVALAVLVADVAQARALVASADEAFDSLASAFWPGPLSVVVERAVGLGYRLGGDEETIGIRCPDHHGVQSLARSVGPLAVTSANRHGGEPCTNAAQLRSTFGVELDILDGGRCDGVPSTVVKLHDGELTLLRAGALEFDALLAVLA